MELERQIEKLLRAYAKKRRADAGAAFALHPVARRRLQAAVARRSPEPETGDASLTLWELFRRRWAVLLGFALIVFFGATLFLPALGTAKQKSPKALAMNQGKTRELQAGLDEKAKPAAPPVAAAEFADGRREVAAQSQLAANRPVPAPAPAMREETLTVSGGGPHGFAGGGGGAPASAGSVTAVTGGTLAPGMSGDKNGRAAGVGGAVAGLPALAAPAAATVRALDVGDSSVAQNSFAYKSLGRSDAAKFGLAGNNSQRFVQAAASPAGPPPVLASFEVRQNGSAIAVVDRDGSVYNGTLQPVAPAARDDLAGVAAVVDRPALLSDTLPKDVNLAGNGQSPAQNYFFRVAGSNRSLQQNVVFTGNLIAISNAPAGAAQNFGGQNGNARNGPVQAAGANAALSSQFNNSRIAGTATIDATNKIAIDAVPVVP